MDFAIISKLIDLVIKLSEQIQGRDKKAASYFDALGVTLSKMAATLRDGKIPTEEGNKFESLVNDWSDNVSGFAAQQHSHEILDALKIAAERAKRLDWHHLLYVDVPEINQHKEQWLKDMERLAGRLQALAITVRPA